MIPFIDLAAQQAQIKPQIDAAIARVLEHGKYIMGPEVKELESQFCDFVGSKNCITVSNGTDALSVALMALEIGPGDAIITTPFTFFATVESIMLRGATPIFADVDPETYNICPREIEKAIARVKTGSDLKIRGIIPVDLYGLPADYRAIERIAQEHKLFVLQDAAQAFGAKTTNTNGKERFAPGHGHLGTASFFPAKPLGCYGDGGAVFTDDDELADTIRSIRVHGKGVDKYDNIRVGLNARLDTIQAAILIEKLKIYPEEFEKRQAVAQHYTKRIHELNDALAAPAATKIQVQQVPDGFQSAWAQFVIQHPQRDRIATNLKAAGIPTIVYYRTPANELKACQDLPLAAPMPASSAISKSILALPFHPYLESSTIDQIVDVVAESVTNVASSRTA